MGMAQKTMRVVAFERFMTGHSRLPRKKIQQQKITEETLAHTHHWNNTNKILLFNITPV